MLSCCFLCLLPFSLVLLSMKDKTKQNKKSNKPKVLSALYLKVISVTLFGFVFSGDIIFIGKALLCAEPHASSLCLVLVLMPEKGQPTVSVRVELRDWPASGGFAGGWRAPGTWRVDPVHCREAQLWT